MKIIVLGAGMMGRAIAYDLDRYSNFDNITIADKDDETLRSAENFLEGNNIDFTSLNVEDANEVKKHFQNIDITISAVPYRFNYNLAKIAIETKTHFLDLGGNNNIVEKERSLFEKARKKGVTIIPDCGLAPGLTSVITRDIVEQMDSVDYVKLRVGGLPMDPKPPLNYQIAFSPNGLINEYVEDAIILDHGKIIKKRSMTDIETVSFPEPFGDMEAFITSGGCSTLPYTYKEGIGYLDYKTIRYPGHCEKFKPLLDMGLAEENPVDVRNQKIIPRDLLIALLLKNVPTTGKDVVLLKVLSEGIKNDKKYSLEYTMIDHYDDKNDISAMMRTTGYPVSIIAQMIECGTIEGRGVFCSEEIVPCAPFFEELRKRNININKEIR
ncbi:saccharopine dehydrogenase-like oxidoreductase [Thermoplasmatales archaeon SCGC AB-539-N05]|nr:saccharopine dehydrogenase-like oxidoreductase [Thermoplasmatales archaeon SCGC AB-539-N05]